MCKGCTKDTRSANALSQQFEHVSRWWHSRTNWSAACGALSDTYLKQQVTAQVYLHLHG